TREAATVAASPMPNAVPFTAPRAFSMILATPLPECPRPESFASASWSCNARLKPLVIAVPARSPAPATAAPPSTFPAVLTQPKPDRRPEFSASFSTPPIALRTDGARPLVSATRERYAVPSSTPAATAHLSLASVVQCGELAAQPFGHLVHRKRTLAA